MKLLEIGVPLIATFAILLLVLVTCLFVRRTQIQACATFFGQDSKEKKSVYLFHAFDNEAHNAVNQVLMRYLKETFNCTVLSQKDVQRIQSANDQIEKQLTDADLIVIIHSEVAFRLYNLHKVEGLNREFCSPNDLFLLWVAKLVGEQQRCLKDKVVCIRFDYTPKYFVIEELNFKGFKLPDEINALNQFIKCAFKQPKMQSLDESIIGELMKSISLCKTFQADNPLWISDLCRNITKSSLSSDDSGVDVHRDLINKHYAPKDYNSIYKYYKHKQNSFKPFESRSMSSDTLSGHLHGSASLHSRNSFCFLEVEKRFISPEFGDEKEDTATVLLAEQMKAINERYNSMVNNECESNEDYVTQLGTSV